MFHHPFAAGELRCPVLRLRGLLLPMDAEGVDPQPQSLRQEAADPQLQ